MPLKDGSLTRGEKAFIESYAELQDRKRAEKDAGLRPGSGYSVLARPEIQKQLATRQLARITSDIVPLALSEHERMLRDKHTPAGPKATLIKLAYDIGIPSQTDTLGKELHEMTPAELDAAIHTAQLRLANLAKDVTPDPSPEKGDIFE